MAATYCQTRIPNAIGQCTRRALPDRQHCGQHAQAAFVADWREQHPDEVYTEPWVCPLCRFVKQERAADEAAYRGHTLEGRIAIHLEREHGDDWQRYLQAGQAPGGAGEGQG